MYAPVAQRIEHWPPEPGARVRFPPGAFHVAGIWMYRSFGLDRTVIKILDDRFWSHVLKNPPFIEGLFPDV